MSHDLKNESCPLNDPETYCNQVVSGLSCTCKESKMSNKTTSRIPKEVNMSGYSPRNDYVVFKRVTIGHTPTGIAVGSSSQEGFRHYVIAIGPKVEGLDVGDEIQAIGKIGEDYAPLPNTKDLYIIKEQNIVLIYKDTGSNGEQ